jgi:hypothetical protein
MNPSGLRARAKQAAAALKAEYDAGKQGDDTPPAPIWPSPKEQLEGLLALLGMARGTTAAPELAEAETETQTETQTDTQTDTGATTATGAETEAALEREAGEVAGAMRGVDWAGVRAATAERGSETARAMRTMAQQVDWTKVQASTARVSGALIAAVAAGQIPLGGRIGSTVARTLVDQRLAQRVATQLQDEPAAAPAEFRHAIEATSREC